MTIKITIEYRTVEEAITALGKMGGLMPDRDSPAQPPIPEPVTPPVATKPRRGRPRNATVPPQAASQGQTQAAPQPKSDTPAPVVASPVAASATPATPDKKQDSTGQEPTAATPTLEDLQKGIELIYPKGVDVCMALLARHGVKRARELKPNQYVEFAKDIQGVLDGKYNPISGERAEGV